MPIDVATPKTPGVTELPGAAPQEMPKDGPANVGGAPEPKKEADKPKNPWAKVPPVATFPRPGVFTVPPAGPGYYSLFDQIEGRVREKPPAFPYPPFVLQPPSFFDANYSYLDNPDFKDRDFFDSLKRFHPTPDTMMSIGGQHSIRYMNEIDSRLGPVNNDYSLIRNRVYADMWYQDRFRIYAELISGVTEGQTLAPLPIDKNRADILNLFADVGLFQVNGNNAYLRVGRQELLYGSQRAVSTLDWANTRRTFDGLKLFWHSEKFDIDAFWTRPVIIKGNDWDTQNHNVDFYGAWATYRPEKGKFFDLYYLGLSNHNLTLYPGRPTTGPGRAVGGFDLHTFGARAAGNQGNFLYDFEGMLQVGQYIGDPVCAYAWTAAVGYQFKDCPWNPQIWVSNDYASGGDPASGTRRTFNQLFPFGHFYFGFADIVGRQNINDFNIQLAAYPENWITLIAQYHNFQLASNRDFLYNAGGVATRRSVNGNAGLNVGNEFDFLVNFHLSQHQDLAVGYSKLFAGDFIRNTGANVSPELFYLMYNFRW
jgi:hypothetical protein